MKKGTGIGLFILALEGFLILFNFRASAQDVQFSQFYASPMFLNPAFAGSAHMNRVTSHTRLQWPGLNAKYITTLASFDTYFPKVSSGLGVQALFDRQGSGNIRSTALSAVYSYELTLLEEVFFRSGFQIGYTSTRLDYNELIFSDQVTSNGIAPSTQAGTDRIHNLDLSVGGALYTGAFWLGYSAHHVNRPNYSFLDQDGSWPVKHTFVTGYKFVLAEHGNTMLHSKSSYYIVPTLHYKFQGMSDQFDAGVYYLHDIYLLGGWYRGIPLKKYNENLHNNESIVLMAGIKIQQFSVSYSYDWVISKLSPGAPVGAHELNLVYVFDGKQFKSPAKRLPCPSL